jgi:hypothetical protein
MITLNRNQFHLFVKRFLAQIYQMHLMSVTYFDSERKKGGGFSLAHTGKINPTPLFDLLKADSVVRSITP